MIESLKTIYVQLVQKLEIDTYRYLYKQFNLQNRLVGLIGPRGTGKTTLMLQYIRDEISDLSKVFYMSADHIYFNKTTLFDFIQKMYTDEGIKKFFIDEVHKYKNWNQELKNIYDSFKDVKVVFSGSSSIDLVKGTYDLSRRAVIYRLKGLSFREYLNFKTNQNYPVISFDEIINNYEAVSADLSQIEKISGYFKEYLKYGYYPFIFEGKEFYFQKLMNIIEKTIFEDISNFYNLKTEHLNYFKKILYFLATIPPGKINIHNLAKNLKVDDKTALHYVTILKETGLVSLLFSSSKGTSLLKTPEKIFIENSTLYHTICYELGQEANIGMLRELFFAGVLKNAGENVFYSKSVGDFQCGDFNFEIGGRTKNKKQIIKDLQNSFLVKDDILIASKHCIPLYLFGFLY